jgi:hypothetical protein
MAPLNQDAEALTPPSSPLPESSATQDVTCPHRISTSAGQQIGTHAHACWDGQTWLNDTWSLQGRNHASLSPTSLAHPMSREEAGSALESGPIRRRPSLLIPKGDIQNDAPDICPCCHLRRRSSAESIGLRSPKHIHTALDECCNQFCPDLSLPQAGYSPIARPHVGRSRLCEETSWPHK